MGIFNKTKKETPAQAKARRRKFAIKANYKKLIYKRKVKIDDGVFSANKKYYIRNHRAYKLVKVDVAWKKDNSRVKEHPHIILSDNGTTYTSVGLTTTPKKKHETIALIKKARKQPGIKYVIDDLNNDYMRKYASISDKSNYRADKLKGSLVEEDYKRAMSKKKEVEPLYNNKCIQPLSQLRLRNSTFILLYAKESYKVNKIKE